MKKLKNDKLDVSLSETWPIEAKVVKVEDEYINYAFGMSRRKEFYVLFTKKVKCSDYSKLVSEVNRPISSKEAIENLKEIFEKYC